MKNLTFLKRVLWLLIPLLILFNISAWGADPVASQTATDGGTYVIAYWNGSAYKALPNVSTTKGTPAGTTITVNASGKVTTVNAPEWKLKVNGSNPAQFYIYYTVSGTNYYLYKNGTTGTSNYDIQAVTSSQHYWTFTAGTGGNAGKYSVHSERGSKNTELYYYNNTKWEVSGTSTVYNIILLEKASYTITATRNNNDYGTVSVTGTTITATPAAGYKVMSGASGYTVVSGTATVTNNGDNTFTVSPSSDCTIRINFESKGCTDHNGDNVISGTETSGMYGPVYPYYEFSTRQILYTRTDLGLAAGKKGTIKSIYFQYANASAMTGTNSVKIYMANTNLSALSTSNYLTSFTEVYSGALNCKDGWNEITLTTPFDYNGIGNLVVVIDDNSNKDEGSSAVFKYHTTSPTTNYAQLYTHAAYTNADPTAAATWTGSTETNNRPNTKFCIQEADMVPATVTLMDNGATITEASAGAGVTLPSRAGCTGYTFAGWTKTWVAPQSSWTTTAPTIIPAGSYTPAGDENLYPVYTKTEGGGTTETTVTETFTNQTSHSSVTDWKQTLTWDASESNASIEWTTYYGKIANGYTEIRTYNDNKMGYLWTSEPITGLKKVKFKGWRVTESDAANMVVSYSTDNDTWYELGTHAATSDNSTFSDEFEITSSDPSTAYYLSIDLSDATCPSSSNKKYRIDDIVITTETGGGSTTSYISVPGCCTNWSTPTVSYSSSLAINASEAVTISSGTTHGAVTYESSDEDVLTVDADGTIHAVGAGTAHIIATWAGDATYCEKSANSNDVTVSGIQVTGTTPVNFGQVYQNAAVANKTIYVTGLGLASPITPSLPVGSPFSFSPASLAKDCSGATLTISASTATLGTYNQTLTLTSGAFSATVTVKMEVIAKPTATFTDALHELTTDKNGASLNSFNLEAAQGTPVVFPTLANQTKSAGTCEGEYYIFAGWTEGDNNTDPQDHLVTSHTLANGDAKHYYAVWADASGSVTYTKLTSNSFSTSAHYVIGAESGGTDYFLYSCEKTDANNSWGLVSSDPATDAPIQFTLSGTASALVAASTEATTRYLKAASGKQFFGMSSSSTTVVLGSGGTIESTADTYNNLRYNSAGGLRWYTGTTTGDAVYFYEVGSSGTVHYRTSCCANKVDAPVVTATTVTSTSITLTWPADVKATGWEVSWNGGAFGAPSGTCTHTVSGLTPNTTYTWKVRATYNAPQCGADTRSGSTTTHQVYHVTYAKGSGTGSCTASGSTTDETGYEAGATVTLQANEFLLSGHTFAGWTEDDEDITISSNQFTMPDHDVVITASWTAKVDKYFDRMHDQTDASHGGVAETEGTNEGKYYILKEGCSYSVPTAVDSKTGDACQTSHYKLRGWIAASYVNSKGEITDESKIFSPGTTKTAGGYTYYAVWAEVVE